MTINGPIYSRGSSNGANTIKAYNKFSYKTLATIDADSMGKMYRDDDDGNASRNFSNIFCSSGNTTVISGVPNHSIEVTDYTAIASGATVLTFLSDSNVISGPMSLGANDFISGGLSLKTNLGESLVINLTGSVVSGSLSYRLV